MSSGKDTFASDSFAANTFACGAWRGIGVAPVVVPAGGTGRKKDFTEAMSRPRPKKKKAAESIPQRSKSARIAEPIVQTILEPVGMTALDWHRDDDLLLLLMME